jgi:hypothetical protein
MADPAKQPDPNQPAPGSPAAPPDQIDQGAYEVLRRRLIGQGQDLRARIEKLNASRKEVFGTIPTKLLSSESIATQHNCIPKDIAFVAGKFLFGYNVQFGLKTEVTLADVFAVNHLSEGHFVPDDLAILADERFEKDFKELYRYYKNARFSQLYVNGPNLYMKFQVGRTPDDFKAFKWLIKKDSLQYLDNRSDHELKYPPQQEIVWTRTTRDDHRKGDHPHISVLDLVFVETIGGDLTIKVEDNTATGKGIYSEPVDNPDQTLDDSEIHYARIGQLILLKVKPFQEKAYRHFTFHIKSQKVLRCDGLAGACVLLPEDHGLIYSSGYILDSGKHHAFPDGPPGMLFERRIASPNGEDSLFIFYEPHTGTYALLGYNLIEMAVTPPILCNGYSLYDNGGLAFFKADAEPRKHHPVQLWQTPFVGDDFRPDRNKDSYLFKIGNKDIVRGMSECVAILDLIDRQEIYPGLYADISRAAGELLDGYHWLTHPDCFNPAQPIREIRETANATVSEFERVVQIRNATRKQHEAVASATNAILSQNNGRIYDTIVSFVEGLAGLREVRGDVIGLRDLRYIDRPAVDALEAKVAQQSEDLGNRAAEFLLKPEALDPYRQGAQAHSALIEKTTTVTQAKELGADVQKSADELEMLIQVVSNLKIDDANIRTAIVEGISSVFSQVNGSRSRLRARVQELGRKEGAAEFASQLKLLDQSVANYIDLADSPQKAQDFLTKTMVQLEELDGKFAEFDEFITRLSDKRQEIYNAFESRRLALAEQRSRRSNNLSAAADRILKGVRSRIESFKTVAEINGFFAADLMVQKVRDLIEELRAMQEPVRADDIQSKLKTAKEESVRQLKDKQDLFVGGQNVIKLGRHNFSVNTQGVDVTILPRDSGPALHVGGTQFFEPIDDKELTDLKDVWELQTQAESPDLYRAEFLAAETVDTLTREASKSPEAHTPPDDARILAVVHRLMSERLDEGYTKGVHDVDALKIASVLVGMESTLGLLKFPGPVRALATLFWATWEDENEKPALASRLRGLGRAARAFKTTFVDDGSLASLITRLTDFASTSGLFAHALAKDAAQYLFEEATAESPGITMSPQAVALRDGFRKQLLESRQAVQWQQTLDAMRDRPLDRFRQARAWVLAYTQSAQTPAKTVADFLDETAVLVFLDHADYGNVINASTQAEIAGLVGNHPRISAGSIQLDYHEFHTRLARHRSHTAPRYLRLQALKQRILADARKRLKIDELKAKVLTSFVRNKLIDEVFLPLIGDNLAKQLGTVGETTRTDRMGMLLLISPPGYGKTTLMEYVANRLGVVFVKVNGPALGHSVKSLDPAEATNAAARQELEKIGLALEMGDNVALYIDDIQHCNPEFLQKFISLCDATRRIEGVYRGRTRTYDLRGRKFAVVMAGNPYTESGARFQIPDMLANRSDTYNLGDILGDHGEAFKLSYLENVVGANPVLNPLASRARSDVLAIVKMAATGSREGIALETAIPEAQLDEMVAVMKKLIHIRDIILKVNQEYIRSANQEDQFRTEPRFQLQGSYRNMNRIAERVVAVMNDHELETAVYMAYEQDAQTLTTGAEANLLKFREISGTITPDQEARWKDIKRTFQRNNQVKSLGGEEKTAQVLVLLSAMNQALTDVRDAVSNTGAAMLAQGKTPPPDLKVDLSSLAQHLESLAGPMQALPELIAQAVQATGQSNSAIAQGLSQALASQPQAAAATQSMPSTLTLDPSSLSALEGILKELSTVARQASPAPVAPLASGQPEPLQEELDNLNTPASTGPIDPAAEAQKLRRTQRALQSAIKDERDKELRSSQFIPATASTSAIEVKIVNKVPATFLYILRAQFDLMRGWLDPLTKVNQRQDEHIVEIRSKLIEMANRYDHIIRGLEAQDTSEESKPQ